MKPSSDGSCWYLMFSRAGVIRQIQEEPNLSSLSAVIPLWFLAFSYGKIATLPYSVLDSPVLSDGSCYGFTTSVASCQFSTLVLFRYVSVYGFQVNSVGMASWEGPRLDSFARAP